MMLLPALIVRDLNLAFLVSETNTAIIDFVCCFISSKKPIDYVAKGPMHKPTVLIADDHVMIVDAFRTLLEPHYEVIGTVADGLMLLEKAPLLKPDVVI